MLRQKDKRTGTGADYLQKVQKKKKLNTVQNSYIYTRQIYFKKDPRKL